MPRPVWFKDAWQEYRLGALNARRSALDLDSVMLADFLNFLFAATADLKLWFTHVLLRATDTGMIQNGCFPAKFKQIELQAIKQVANFTNSQTPPTA